MRKFLLIMTLLTIMGGTNSVKAGKTYASLSVATGCTWDSGTNTMGFTAVNGWQILLTGLSGGDITAYTVFHATLSSMSDNIDYIRLRIKDKNGNYADRNLTKGDNSVDLAALATANPSCDFTNIDDITIWSPTVAAEGKTVDDSGNEASVVITDVYMYMPPSLNFDAYGKATTNIEDLSATGGLSYNSSTGVLTSDGTEGELTLEFAEPVDLKYLRYFNVKRSGADGSDNIVDCLKLYDEDGTEINTWNSIKWSNTWSTGLDNNATNAFLNHKPVKKLIWPSAANDSKNGLTLTINTIEWTLKTISCAKAGETQLNTLLWNKMDGTGTEKPNWNMNGTSDTYYGDYSGNPTHYVDLTTYSELRVYCESNSDGFRAFFINADASATVTVSTSAATWHGTEKYYSLDLTSVVKWGKTGTDGIVALKSIKSDPWSGATSGQNVTDIEVYKTPAANTPQYTLTGSGMQLAATVEALADETVTCIDATGVVGNTTNSESGRTLLESANPNCLFLGKVGNGYLANTKNVVDGSTCANLVLEDGYPFKAPADFTATSVSYDRSFTASTTTTVCLPFALSVAEAEALGKFYALTSLSEGTLTFTLDEDEISANTPYLFVPTATSFASYSNKEIEATPASLSVLATGCTFIGTMERTFLKSDASNTLYAYNDGAFVQIGNTNGAYLPAFRAYISVPGAGVKSFNIQFEDVDAIDSIQASASKGQNEIFNLAGQRLSKLQKGVNIVNGKKYIIK